MESSNTTKTKTFNALGNFCQGKEYTKRYEVFLEKCKQSSRVVENLHSYLPSAMQSLHIHTDVCNVLSIGAGDGEVDLEILKIIKEVSKTRLYTLVIEPNEYSLQKYKNALENLPLELTGNDQVIFDINEPKAFQKYMAEGMAERKLFHIVHFVHSIYFMDFEEALTHCYEKELGETGMIVCVLAADGLMYNSKEMLFGISQPNQSITQVAEKYGWKYQEYIDEYLVDVTETLDDQSVTGNLLLDFLTQIINFRATADQKKVKKILEMIRNSSVRKEGKTFGKKKDYYTFIFK